MLLSEVLCSEVIAVAMSTGADFAEIYCEHTKNESIQLVDGKINRIQNNVLSGVGVRAFLGTRTVYASTTDLSRGGLITCAKSVADAIGQSKAEVQIRLTERIFPNIHPVRILPHSADMKQKIDLLRSGCTAAKDESPLISQVSGTLLGVDHTILIAFIPLTATFVPVCRLPQSHRRTARTSRASTVPAAAWVLRSSSCSRPKASVSVPQSRHSSTSAQTTVRQVR